MSTTTTFPSGTGASSPQSRVELVAVEPPRARLEAGRVDQMRRADLGDVHLELGCSRTSTPAAPAWSRWICDSSRCRTSLKLEAALGQARLQLRNEVGPAVVEREAVLGLDEVGTDDALAAEVAQVERLKAHGLRGSVARGGNRSRPTRLWSDYLSAQYAAAPSIGHSRSGSAR